MTLDTTTRVVDATASIVLVCTTVVEVEMVATSTMRLVINRNDARRYWQCLHTWCDCGVTLVTSMVLTKVLRIIVVLETTYVIYNTASEKLVNERIYLLE
jgi:hypothetical protein